MSFNQITLVGNTGTDPTLKYTPNGRQVCDFRLAVSSRRGQNSEEETEWFTIVCWERLAETVAQYLTKGKPVLVSGRFRSSTWQDKEGKERMRNEVVASAVRFLGPSDAASGAPPTEGPPGQEDIENLPW